MRVLFVTPECAPLTKTGGLGDVSSALPAALRALGLDVRTLLPGYRDVLARARGRETARMDVLGFPARLLEWEAFLILDCPPLYDRAGGPYQDADGRDWPDNALRFGALSRAAARIAAGALAWRPELVHCNDWPAALAPVYLALEGRPAASLLTVHNLAFQGLFAPEVIPRLELPAASYSLDGLEFHGRLSFLKGGILAADLLTAVSPTYAREALTEAFGFGLEGVLRRREEALTGILNGIDVDEWNPATDRRIAARYDEGTLERKGLNKRALQRTLGLAEDAAAPLLGAVCRFTHQKGVDYIADAAGRTPAQLCVLGAGDRELERCMSQLAASNPGRIAVRIGFDEDLAHLIEAGADMFLMPSRFEPCGLNQMYSQRYGTPPVARATGGLKDSIADGETGFLFEDDLAAALERALAAYADPGRWRELQRRGMQRDFSWSTPARRYAALYSRAAMRRAA
jgi:starch synthase